MNINKIKELMKVQLDKMLTDSDYLFEVEVDKDKMWDLYLESFPADKNKS